MRDPSSHREQFKNRSQRYNPTPGAPWDNANVNDQFYELDVARTQLEEARVDNSRLQSELNTLRLDFARFQSQFAHINPSVATPQTHQ